MTANSSDEEEALAIARCLDGETDAFAYIVEKYKRQSYFLAYRIVRNSEDAHDLSQEAFLKAFKALGTFRRDAVFKVWFFQILRNTCISHLRKKRNIVSVEANDHFELVDKNPSPEASVVAARRREMVKKAIDRLTPARREVLLLREFQGFSYEDIAKIASITIEQVKSRLHYARKQLIKELKDYLK